MSRKKSNTDLSGKVLEKISEKLGSASVADTSIFDNYKKLYEEQGRKAAENVFGLASNATGGYGNSYAATTAAKAYSDYSDKLAEKAQEIESLNYQKERDSISDLYKQYDKTADYEERALSEEKYLSDKEQSKSKNELSFAETAAKNGDYSYLEALGIDTGSQKQKDALSFAVTAADNGDYSYLEALGIDTDSQKQKEALSFAVTAANNGDYSYLEALGIDTSSMLELRKAQEERERAELLAKYGDYSGLTALGADLTKLNKSELTELAEVYAKYGDYTLLKLLGVNTSSREQDDAAAKRLSAARYYKMIAG